MRYIFVVLEKEQKKFLLQNFPDLLYAKCTLAPKFMPSKYNQCPQIFPFDTV